ncbi:MAG TPA: hypothetical protein VKY74_16520 [Chloroflexia bacterium]|nr:hypothetical protein [Chloroflexia bacterium]
MRCSIPCRARDQPAVARAAEPPARAIPWSWRLLRWLLGHLPVGLGRWIACRIGDGCCRYLPRWRRVALRNMRIVLGPRASRAAVRRAARAVFQNVALDYYDMIRAADLSAATLARQVTFDEAGWRAVRETLRAGRSVLVVSAHYGAIDIVGRILAVRGLRPVLVVDRVGASWQVDLLQWLRARNGWDLCVVGEGAGALRDLLAALQGGRLVFLLVDRNPQPTGIAVPFCGRTLTMSPAAARLARRSGALLVPAFCWRAGARYIVRVEPALPAADVETVTRQIAAVCERYIRRDPAQWLLLTPGWRES